MQRATRTLTAALAVAVLLVGCGAPHGLDGDLTDDWAALAAPGAFTPVAEVCHEADFADAVSLAAYAPVDCATPHRVETVHVGTFPAERKEPPPVASPELRTAFADCDKRANGYVGDNWRAGRLRLAVAVPTGAGWAAGSRWYRCDLMEVTTAEAGAKVVTRSGSLRNALRPPPRCGWGVSRPARTAPGWCAPWYRWTAPSATTPSSPECGRHLIARTRRTARSGPPSTRAAVRCSPATPGCRTTVT